MINFKSSALTFLLAFSLVSFAEEPMSDYHFLCKLQKPVKGSNFIVRGGSDPSGLFVIGSGEWKKLHEVDFLSQRRPLKNRTEFTSVKNSSLKMRLTIFWSKELKANTYLSSAVFQGPNLVSEEVNLICKVEEE
jgi:hypothetical protein